jgi:hypothetical protein
MTPNIDRTHDWLLMLENVNNIVEAALTKTDYVKQCCFDTIAILELNRLPGGVAHFKLSSLALMKLNFVCMIKHIHLDCSNSVSRDKISF